MGVGRGGGGEEGGGRGGRKSGKSAQTPPGIVKGKVPSPVPNRPVDLQSSSVTDGTTGSSTSGCSLPTVAPFSLTGIATC